MYERRLRWPIPAYVPRQVAGQHILAVQRRAKYLLVRLERGTLILHLGMSGSLRVLPAATPPGPHTRLDLLLDPGQTLRLDDPRRFGSLHYTTADPAHHRLLRALAPEPFDATFNAAYLFRVTRGRHAAIKQLLLNGRLVAGLGNIYAAEALFRARIDPRRRAGTLTLAECARVTRAVRAALRAAIRAGGTTLRDYVGADGHPGAFLQSLRVYQREGRACRSCRTPIRRIVQGQRSTFFCPTCQH